jgi:penicillin-binding protein 1A
MSRKRRKTSRLATVAAFFRRASYGLVAILLLAGAATGALLYAELSAALPPLSQLENYRPPTVTQVLADDGTVIGEFFLEKRFVVPLDRIPMQVRDAFVAAEDDGFYRHSGIDPLSIARAFYNNFVAGGTVQGGSTITQQVVKQMLLTPQKSYERKLKEVVLAMRLEQQLSKDEILSLYLNHIYLGSGAYGVAAAAREYFGKSVENLNLAEGALLAGLPQAPSRYSPLAHWRRAKARQRYVLRRMVDAGLIDREEGDEALRQPISLATRRGSYIAAPWYVEHVRRLLEERYGTDALYQMGLRVYTAASLDMTMAAEEALRPALEKLDRRRGGSRKPVRALGREEVAAFRRQQGRKLEGEHSPIGRAVEGVVLSASGGRVQMGVGAASGPLVPSDGRPLPPYRAGDVLRVIVAAVEADGSYRFDFDPAPAVEGAIVALDPRTGHVKAMVGGYDSHRSQFNRAVQAARQPGSAFKPLIYAAALDRNFTPASIIVDEPIALPDSQGVWTPQNFERKFHGPTTLREALTFSRNVVTVKLTMRIGLPYLTTYLKRVGIESPMPKNLSLALGSSEVTPLELAAAYAVLANHGVRHEPVFITRIVNAGGETIFEAAPRAREVIPAATAYQVTSMLQSAVERGTGRGAAALGRPTAGKTGTTNDYTDAWFVGYVPQLLTAVWVGLDEKLTLGSKQTGGRVATPIWRDFMEKATANLPIESFPIPDTVVLTPVDRYTGRRAAPGEGAVILEAFRRGTEPSSIAVSNESADTDMAARAFFRGEAY